MNENLLGTEMKVSSWTFDTTMASNALAKLLPADEERPASRGAEIWPLMYRSDGFISCYAWIETQDIPPTCATLRLVEVGERIEAEGIVKGLLLSVGNLKKMMEELK